MRCTEMEEIISLYIDDMLDEHTKNMIDNHLKECSSCKREYEELLSNIDLCKKLPMVDLPEGFEDALHQALLETNEEDKKKNIEDLEMAIPKKKNKKINWRIFTSFAAILIVCVISISAVSSIRMGSMVKEEMKMEDTSAPSIMKNDMMPQLTQMDSGAKEMQSEEGNVNQTSTKQLEGRKVIKNAYIQLDVENYDQKFNEIANITEAIGGYIENSNTQYKEYVPQKPEESLKTGNITIRVPENRFMHTIEQIKSLGTVMNYDINSQDITTEYRDTVNQVENLKVQEKRLREIMEKTNNIKDILEVERELTRVRGEIDSMTGNIQRWDRLVGLSTIQISLNEIVSKDKTIHPISNHALDKAKKGFIQSVNYIIEFFEKSFVMFISILPSILLVSMIGIPLVWYVKKRIQK